MPWPTSQLADANVEPTMEQLENLMRSNQKMTDQPRRLVGHGSERPFQHARVDDRGDRVRGGARRGVFVPRGNGLWPWRPFSRIADSWR